MGAPEELFSHSCTLVKILKLLSYYRLGEVEDYWKLTWGGKGGGSVNIVEKTRNSASGEKGFRYRWLILANMSKVLAKS